MHLPVLVAEVLDSLAPRAGGAYIDCTVGGGGHAEAVLEASSPDGRLLGLDADPRALARAHQRLERFGARVRLVHANFRELRRVATEHGFVNVQGVLFDLGLSSLALEASGRGFSFQRPDEPLDMRFDPSGGPTAADLLNTASEAELARVFRELGEEPRAARLARAIVQRRRARPFRLVGDLLQVISGALGPRRSRLHPATRAFQALRVATNDELGALREGLAAALELLAPGGRIAVIAFHSLEDRIVKQMFRQHAEQGATPRLAILTRKPLVPSEEEIQTNPRARSAKLRVAERVA